MKIRVYPEKFLVKATSDEQYCQVDLTDEELRYVMEGLSNNDVAKWSMALGAFPYEPGYPSEFIFELARKLLPELKSCLKGQGVDKKEIDACTELIKFLKDYDG